MKFVLVKTNIANMCADAIVLPANTRLKEGSGASAAIFEAAGRKNLTKACNKLGFCEVGSAVPTLAYDLEAKYIIHAVVPKWIDGKHNEYDLLSSAYLSALQVADIMGCESIAFPLLASGNNGFDLELAFQIAKGSIESFTGTRIKKVILVIFGNRITSIVKEYGYEVLEIPENIKKEERKLAHKERSQKLADDSKEIIHTFFEDQMQKGIYYYKDEENREKVIATGVTVAKIAYQIVKNSRAM